MKNTLQPLINQHFLTGLVATVTACIKNPFGFVKDHLVTIYLTGLEVLYILYK
jgi:hypothetical protein